MNTNEEWVTRPIDEDSKIDDSISHVVAFSGGVDSTSIVHQLASRNDVSKIYLIYNNNAFLGPEKVDREMKAVNNIISKFDDEFENTTFEKIIIANSIDKPFMNGRNYMYAQPPMFTNMLLGICGLENVWFYLGYLGSDDMKTNRHVGNYIKLFDTINSFIQGDGNSFELRLPLIGSNKKDMLLYAIDNDFIDDCEVCELYIDKDTNFCTNCHSCNTHHHGLLDISIMTNKASEYAKNKIRKWIR